MMAPIAWIPKVRAVRWCRVTSAVFAVGFGSVLPIQSGACASVATRQGDHRLQAGTWGAQGAALTVTEADAHLELDCGSGDIPQAVMVDVEGRVAVEGVFVREHGGAVRMDELPDRKPARYSGRLSGQTLTLAVTLIESNETVASFTLVYGATPRVRKCR